MIIPQKLSLLIQQEREIRGQNTVKGERKGDSKGRLEKTEKRDSRDVEGRGTVLDVKSKKRNRTGI